MLPIFNRQYCILTLTLTLYLPLTHAKPPSNPPESAPLAQEFKKTVTNNATFFQKQLNVHMQNSAQWLDNLLINDAGQTKRATAKGFVSLGVAPRARDLSDIDSQFKVSFDLPNLEQKLSVIIENDEEAQDRLPYQSGSVAQQRSQLNAALNWYLVQKKRLNLDYRIGISRNNLYAQSRLKYQRKFNNWRFLISPSLEYYVKDGWGSRINTRLDRNLETDQTLNFAINARYVESEPTTRLSLGVFHSHIYDADHAGVMGVWLKDSFRGERSYYTSYRWRKRFYEHWLFFEVEPFVEYRERYDFDDEPGIAIRVIAYYGV